MSFVNIVLRRFKLNKIFLFFARTGFRFFQKIGLHITPNHYYLPIPDTSKLKKELWEGKSELVGLDMRIEEQKELLEIFSKNFKQEYDSFPVEKTNIEHQYYLNNRDFGRVDAEILYCIIRHFKPKNIIEIGSGHSTYLSAQALVVNKERDGASGELIAIEPYPRGALERGFPGLTKFVKKCVQDVELSFFDQLGENDILFIDSSHVLTIGNDVQFEYLELLPRLKKGVIVHIHDIFLPLEYPREWVIDNMRFWNEQYLLQAFLSFNEHFQVLWAGSYMSLNYPIELEKAFKTYTYKFTPGSFWIKKIK